MAIKKGQLEDSLGNILHFETDSSQVLINSSTLDAYLAGLAPINSPSITGTASIANLIITSGATSVTPTAGDNSTKISTTAFVTTAIANVVAGAVTSANKLTTARTISLTGDVTGSISFDGSANVSIAAVVVDDSHNHTINTITSLQSALDSKSPVDSPTFTGTVTAPTFSGALSGNASTTTVLQTSRNINGVAFNGSSNIIVPTIYDSSFQSILNPGGGTYTCNTATVTGAIAITLPVGMTNTMMRMTIKVYEYTTNESFEIHCGGYLYGTGNTWANSPFAYIVGNPNIDRRFNVRFGYTSGGKAVIYIGETTSAWSYPQVFVTDIQCGYSGYSASFTSGWSVGVATTFENVTATISNCQVGCVNSKITVSTTDPGGITGDIWVDITNYVFKVKLGDGTWRIMGAAYN